MILSFKQNRNIKICALMYKSYREIKRDNVIKKKNRYLENIFYVFSLKLDILTLAPFALNLNLKKNVE